MEAVPHPIPRTVEEVFSDFKGRRAGLIKALTTGSLVSSVFNSCFPQKLRILLFMFTELFFWVFVFAVADVEKFYQQCDPGGLL